MMPGLFLPGVAVCVDLTVVVVGVTAAVRLDPNGVRGLDVTGTLASAV